jgi:heat shock protein HslJ
MSTVIRLTLAGLLAVLALASAGCASVGGAPKLDGTSWTLTSWSASSLDPAEFNITAIFKDGQVGGNSGVNSYGGPYEVGSRGSFQVGEIVSTLMAGPEPAQRAETIYHELLKQARKYAVDGDTLTLSDANGNQLLIFSAAK